MTAADPIAACAALVAKGDPDRFAAVMAAPVPARARLLPLYAFNLEIARAPWLTQEPMIAEMRLQWWRDALDEIAVGKPPRAHEVVAPLAQVMRDAGLPPALLDAMIAARRWDIWKDPFADEAALIAHLEATGGNLGWAAALALGAPAGAERAVRLHARAAALAAWLRAVPALEAAGHAPLADPRSQAVAALARQGLGWLAAARAARASVPRAVAPALLAGWQAGPLLRMAAAEPGRVAAGDLALSEFARRWRLLAQSLTLRW